MSKARSRARRLAMQGLYEWQMSGNTPNLSPRRRLGSRDIKLLLDSGFGFGFLRRSDAYIPVGVRQNDEIRASLFYCCVSTNGQVSSVVFFKR